MKNIESTFSEEIFTNHLNVINGTRFTPREVDVIACILNGKTAKGIAHFLSTEKNILRERGIEAHILNIRRKIGGTAKGDIINFIESSDKHLIMRSYYISLMMEKLFKQFLKELSMLIKIHEPLFLIVNYSEQENRNIIIDKIQEHLKLLALESIIPIRQNLDISDTNIEKQHIIYLVLEDEQEICEKIAKNEAKSKSYCIIINKDREFIDNLLPSQDGGSLFATKYISLPQQTNYHYLFFEILKTLFIHDNINAAITRFQDKYKNLLEGNNYNPSLRKIDLNDQDIDITKIQSNKFYERLRKSHIYSLLAIFLTTGGLYSTYNLSNKEQEKIELQQTAESKLADQVKVGEILPKSLEDLSSIGSSKERSEKLNLENSVNGYKPPYVYDQSIVNRLPSRINNFIGRKGVFAQIDEILSNNRFVAINAFAGTGKSSTALEYGHRLLISRNKEQIKQIVYWFDCDSKGKLEVGYRQLAADLGIKINQNKAILINLVNNAIAKLDKLMLFIFDNLEDYQVAEEYLINLPSDKVKVIITTRNNDILKNNKKLNIRLEPFNKKDAVEYINTSLEGRVNSEDAQNLIKTLGDREGEVLPYKLSKAVAYLRENKLCTIREYIEYINEHLDDQVETSLLIGLVGKSPRASQILQYAAYLDPDFISVEIFKELLSVDEDNLQKPIMRLEQLSLMDLNHSDGQAYLKIHRLMQEEVIKYRMRHPEQVLAIEDIYNNLIVNLNNLMPKVIDMPDKKWQQGKLYYSHARKLLADNHNIAQAEQAELYMKLGRYSEYIDSNFKQSLKDHLAALKIYQELYQGNHQKVAYSLRNVGYAYYDLGDFEKGLSYFKQALKMRQELYQGDHEDVASSLDNVGCAYQALGDFEKGLKYKEQALKMYQELYPGDHPEVAIALNNVGRAYHALGDFEKGRQYLEQALEMFQNLHPGNHPDVAMSLNNVGCAYQALGDFEKGLKYKEQALKMYQELYRGNHRDVTMSLHDVGCAYKVLSDNNKAIELYKQAYLMKVKVLGAEHPSTIKVKEKLEKEVPEFFVNNEIRTPILKRGIINDNIIQVKQKIQEGVLNKIYEKAAKGNWSSGLFTNTASILGDWGVNGYLDNKFLYKELGEVASPETIEIAQMLCFEAMCLGVMSAGNKDLTCIREFVKVYPELLAKIIAEHPEYMVDGLIVKECVSDPEILTKLLGENLSSQD